MTTEHPSFFALDLVALDAASAEVIAHVATCDRCKAHVEAVRPATGLVPAWVAPPRRSRIGVAIAIVALAAAVFLFVRTRSSIEPYVGEKGAPAVEILVQGDAKPWDGRVLHAGDRLGLMVTCAGREQVSFGTLDEARILAHASCQKGAFQLPVSVVLDAQGTEDTLVFLFGSERAPVEMLRGPAVGFEKVSVTIRKEPK